MEMNNSAQDFKSKPVTQYGENTSRSGPSTSLNNPWQENGRDRKHGKKRDRTPEKEWGRDKMIHGRNRENTKDEEGKDRFKEEQKVHTVQQQPPPLQMQPSVNPAPYSNNGYCTSDYYNVDTNQNNFHMMPQYNAMYGAMNHQWTASNLAANPSMSGMPVPGMEMVPTTSTGMNPYPYVVPADPSMYGMMPSMAGYCQFSIVNSQENPPILPKTIKTFSNFVLNPPQPSAPPPTRRDRPLGCKTVFVGGLPEEITEEIIKEAFQECGEIVTVRMSKKNFCHIRFSAESFVDEALYFSGYRIKIENKDDATYNGRLHVDFAVARDDQYEYECHMRALQREARHRELLEQQSFRAPTPPPIVHYTESEAANLGESLRNEETFKKAVQILITWLERGECNKRNAGTFYSMIQSTNSHVRRLMNEKAKIEEEVRQMKCKLNQKCAANAIQYNDIEKVFVTAAMQKVWDHFTRAQRKNLDLWKKQTKEIKESNMSELITDRVEDEMEMSDGEDSVSLEGSPADRLVEENEDQLRLREENDRLREENELIRSQLRVSQNELAMVKDEGERKFSALSDTYQVMQQNYVETKKKLEEVLKERSGSVNIENSLLDNGQIGGLCSGTCKSTPGTVSIAENEVCLVALIATFLNVHPFGASIDYICSYLVKIDSTVSTRDVESLMKKFPTVFKEESTGIGATLEKKWTFLGFKF